MTLDWHPEVLYTQVQLADADAIALGPPLVKNALTVADPLALWSGCLELADACAEALAAPTNAPARAWPWACSCRRSCG